MKWHIQDRSVQAAGNPAESLPSGASGPWRRRDGCRSWVRKMRHRLRSVSMACHSHRVPLLSLLPHDPRLRPDPESSVAAWTRQVRTGHRIQKRDRQATTCVASTRSPWRPAQACKTRVHHPDGSAARVSSQIMRQRLHSDAKD